MKLIIGLGNPGKDYELTRHNIGFMAVEYIASQNSIRMKFNKKFKAVTGEGLITRENCYLAMPQAFMNLSGNSVRSIVNWLKIDLKETLVVIDDISLPFGNLRIKPKGSDGGHKGLRSLIDCLGTNEFSRLRIGIMPKRPVKDLSQYVLQKFTKLEQKSLRNILSGILAACGCWIQQGIDSAMNRYN